MHAHAGGPEMWRYGFARLEPARGRGARTRMVRGWRGASAEFAAGYPQWYSRDSRTRSPAVSQARSRGVVRTSMCGSWSPGRPGGPRSTVPSSEHLEVFSLHCLERGDAQAMNVQLSRWKAVMPGLESHWRKGDDACTAAGAFAGIVDRRRPAARSAPSRAPASGSSMPSPSRARMAPKRRGYLGECPCLRGSCRRRCRSAARSHHPWQGHGPLAQSAGSVAGSAQDKIADAGSPPAVAVAEQAGRVRGPIRREASSTSGRRNCARKGR